jgi:protein-disulfide isomerase
VTGGLVKPEQIGRRSLVLGTGAALATLAIPTVVEARVVRLPSELVNDIDRLPGRVVLGNRQGDVTLYEFFDYNCGFCKQSAQEVRPLVSSDRRLRYVLVNYAILGEASIEASRVALAASMQPIKGGYLALHERLFKIRGRADAARSVALALELGAERRKLIEDADSDRVTDALTKASKLGDSLGLVATPSFVAGREGVVGYLDLPQKRRALANLRKCEAMGC